MSLVYLDFETRSRADLKEVGAHRYARDPSTEILMAGVSGPRVNDPVYLWVNPKFETVAMKSEPEALELLRFASTVYAHNAPFEQAILGEGTDPFPFIGLNQWRCTQAMARIAGIPESLEKCAIKLKLMDKKDPMGSTLIKLFSIPDKGGNFGDPLLLHAEWKRFGDYCRQDVKVERAIHHALREYELTGSNLETFLFTLRMNDYGVPVNRTALENAKAILEPVQEKVSREFLELTGLNVTQREKFLVWLDGHGVSPDNLQADTVEELLKNGNLDPIVRRALVLYSQSSYVATKKIYSMLDWVCPDDRLHGVFKFYGAGTGRWSAGGPQLQNAKKPTPAMRPLTMEAYQYMCDGGDAAGMDALYGDPIEVIASCVRHFVHQPGHELLDGDYNAIEPRIGCWVAGEKRALEEYRRNEDRYRKMAGLIYGKSPSAVTDDERALGKVAILGLGYGMGTDKFLASCRHYGVVVNQTLAQKAVDSFRTYHPEIVKRWRSLTGIIESLAHQPAHPMLYAPGGGISISMSKGTMWVSLPSGRKLYYPDLHYSGGDTVYYGQIPMTQTWGDVKLYGAKLYENIVQGIAADVMSHGAREAEKRQMFPFALIHDQALALRMHPGQTAKHFADALATLPKWATGLPLKVEAKVVPFYSK